jgi:hypothetical protein
MSRVLVISFRWRCLRCLSLVSVATSHLTSCQPPCIGRTHCTADAPTRVLLGALAVLGRVDDRRHHPAVATSQAPASVQGCSLSSPIQYGCENAPEHAVDNLESVEHCLHDGLHARRAKVLETQDLGRIQQVFVVHDAEEQQQRRYLSTHDGLWRYAPTGMPHGNRQVQEEDPWRPRNEAEEEEYSVENHLRNFSTSGIVRSPCTASPRVSMYTIHAQTSLFSRRDTSAGFRWSSSSSSKVMSCLQDSKLG